MNAPPPPRISRSPPDSDFARELGDKAGVEEVQSSVLNSPNVCLFWKELIGLFGGEVLEG